MNTLKKYFWDIQPWYQRVSTVIMLLGLLFCSVLGWIDLIGG